MVTKEVRSLTKDEAVSVIQKLAPGCEVLTIVVGIEGHEFVYNVEERKWEYDDDTDDTDDTDDAEDAEIDVCRCEGGEFCHLCTPVPGKDIGT